MYLIISARDLLHISETHAIFLVFYNIIINLNSILSTIYTCFFRKSANPNIGDNFFVIDNQPTGTGIEMIFPKNVSGTGRGIGDIAVIEGNKIVFKRDLVAGESIYCSSLEGINNSSFLVSKILYINQLRSVFSLRYSY